MSFVSGCDTRSALLLFEKSFDFSTFTLGERVIQHALRNGSKIDNSFPQIIRPKLILGTRIAVRAICLEDAEFVVALRGDSERGHFLSDVSDSVEAQSDWLRGYLKDESQAYFVIHDIKTYSPVGLVRMYGACENSFSWGSWVFLRGSDSFLAFESAMLIYQYAFLLGFDSAYFDVRIANFSVRRFHEKLGAVEVNSEGVDIFYEFYGYDIRAAFGKYSRFSPSQLKIYF